MPRQCTHLHSVENLVHHLDTLVLVFHLFDLQLLDLVGNEPIDGDEHDEHRQTCQDAGACREHMTIVQRHHASQKRRLHDGHVNDMIGHVSDMLGDVNDMLRHDNDMLRYITDG